jgi:pyridoxal phosphate phosphatase PHOSPHO2
MQRQVGADFLVIFDFDWSLINENSDTWIFEKLCPELYNELKSLRHTYKGRWTELMDHLVGRMMAPPYNISVKDINDAFASIPVFSETLDALRIAKDSGSKISILSDANEHYISIILEHHELGSCISSIVTNRSTVCSLDGSLCGTCDTSGVSATPRLHIVPYQSPSYPHGCPLCPINLCKGVVLDEWRAQEGEFSRRVVYVGDGSGDYCPVARLGEADVVLCRDGWALHRDILNKKGDRSIAAKIVPWTTGADILSEFRSIFL